VERRPRKEHTAPTIFHVLLEQAEDDWIAATLFSLPAKKQIHFVFLKDTICRDLGEKSFRGKGKRARKSGVSAESQARID